jgi:hypothetical protein
MIELSQSTALPSTKMGHQPRVLVITSCTGQKRFKLENQLTLEDFKDSSKLAEREASLSEFACRAGQMYIGLQHLRTMEGVNLLRQSFGREVVDVKILSAGYGLISEDKKIVPYQVTFNTMKGYEFDEWVQFMEVHQAVEKAIFDYDLIFILLGDKYLRSLRLPIKIKPSQTLIFLTSKASASYIPKGDAKLFSMPLSNAEASLFRCGLVGLKGHLFNLFAKSANLEPELLQKVYQEPHIFKEIIAYQQPVQLELLLNLPNTKINQKLSLPTPTNKQLLSDYFIHILNLPPASNQHLGMRYFIPEWNDRVDPGYRFETDTSTHNRIPSIDDVYAHDIYGYPNYDGILVSKVVVDKSKRKKQEIEKAGGIHEFIRFYGEIMGDCGAFGYIKQDEPPYHTEEILEYYERLGFNYGVSIDHLIVGQFAIEGVREKRYILTLKNAEDFIEKHKAGGYTFTPIGVAQGWSPDTYAKAVKELINMGYNYVALGGLARAPTKSILEILVTVYPHLKPNTNLHLLGVGRVDSVLYFRHLGVTSFDSSSPLRSAWLDSAANYHTPIGKSYAAIRIPSVNKGGNRIKHLLETGLTHETLSALEENSLIALRKFDADELSLEETLHTLLAYDELLELPRDGKVDPQKKAKRQQLHAQMYRQLLNDKPWKLCDCKVCQSIGVEVVIFRGNDRNRRRGFHNTYVFYKRFKEILAKK